MNSKNTGFRTYETESEIEIGHVLIMKSDLGQPGYNPFASMIIERIDGEEVTLCRPMARADGTAYANLGSAWLHAERVRIPKHTIVATFVVYTTGVSGNFYKNIF